MRALLIHAGHNTTKPDATGAFIPEARNYAKWLTAQGWDVTLRAFDNRAEKPARRREVEGYIVNGDGPWDHIAFFGHGLKTSIQSGHTVDHVPALVDLLRDTCSPRLIVTLYACDAARDGDRDKRDDVNDSVGGDGGFADVLRDALYARGMTGHVDAHAKPGHATKNPHVRRFDIDEHTAGDGWLVSPVPPKDATKAERDAVRAKWRAWIRALKGDMRWRFPWLTPAEIDRAL